MTRPRLFEVLDADPTSHGVLVCAPTGFGKSVVVSQWCETLEPAVVWLSLDPSLTRSMGAAGERPQSSAVVVPVDERHDLDACVGDVPKAVLVD